MSELSVTSTGTSGEFNVEVGSGGDSRHRVTVPPGLLDRLGLTASDAERLVRESFAFLLEREPPSSILRVFSLEVIPRYFPEYEETIRTRLG